MVKDKIQVEKLLLPKPGREVLDYPAQQHYEPPQSDETTAKKRQREQRNQKKEPTGKTNARQPRRKDQW